MEAAAVALVGITFVAVVAAALSYRRAVNARRDLARLNNYDRLTGLPNRNRLRGWLDTILKESRRSTARVAVVFVELNRFEYLDETYGHEVGDALMVAASKALKASVQKGELLVRYGGPQFVVAVPDVPGPVQARRRAETLLDAVERQYEIGQDRIRLSANVGIALTDQQYSSAEDVLLDAQAALRHSIDEGKGAVSLFDAAMRNRYSPSAAEHRLREALDRSEFWLLYLPVVDLADRQLIGVEALLRWADPEIGLVSPAHFMKSLDETGLIVPVGAWVIEETCRQARDWQDRFPDRPLEVTVNVSPRQLMQSDFAESIEAALESSGVDAPRLTVEITEGALMHDVDGAWATLRQVKAQGVKLTLDDFGTGHSSLGYLRTFRLDNLKIDRSFVNGLRNSREDEAIVQQIIGLAHALGMRAMAEGVERADQAEVLRSLGCDAAQGYYYSTPQPADVIDGLLAKSRLDPSHRPTTLDDVVQTSSRGTVVRPELD